MAAATIRPLDATRDDLVALTALLNRAYAPLAAAGMNFTAATQDVATTRERVARGRVLVAEDGAGRIVGCLGVADPYDPAAAPWAADARWLCAPDSAHLQQFAVEPALQRAGLGRALLRAGEADAVARGYVRAVLDTAEPAAHLRRWYAAEGYAEVGHVRWEGKAYRSVVMTKPLVTDPLRLQLLQLARYHAWATGRLLDAIAPLDEADYRRDLGLAFRSLHGTLNHLAVAELALWWPRFAEGRSPRLALDAEIEPDRERLAARLRAGARGWAALIGALPPGRESGPLSYTMTTGEPQALPVGLALAHVFNHATHHRGQCSAALTALGRPAPVLDLVPCLREEARYR